MESLTREITMKKAVELDDYRKFLETYNIEQTNFKVYKGVVATLSILGAPKDKKSKAKKTAQSQ